MAVIVYAVVERSFTPTVSAEPDVVDDCGTRLAGKMLTAAAVVKLDENGVEASPSARAAFTETRYSVPGVRIADGVNVPVVVVVASVPATAVPLGSVTAILMDAALTALLKVAFTVVRFATAVAPLAGVMADTVGAVSVVKDQTVGVIAVPSGLAAPTVAVYLVLAARTADGVNLTVVLVVATAPATATPEAFTTDSVDLAGSTALVNVTKTVELAATPVALVTGERLATTGAGETVLNVHVYGLMTTPDALVAFTVAV
jgi:hypothetical protein